MRDYHRKSCEITRGVYYQVKGLLMDYDRLKKERVDILYGAQYAISGMPHGSGVGDPTEQKAVKTYHAGTEMVSAAYADGGTAYAGYWCKTCEEYMRRYFEPGDETGEGEIYEGDPEGWEALKAEMEATP